MTEVAGDIQEKLLEAIQAKRWGEADEVWAQLLEGPPMPTAFHEVIIGRFARRKNFEKMRELYDTLLEARLAMAEFAAALAIIELLLAVDPLQTFLRGHLLAALRGLHADRDRERIQHFLKDAGLDGDATDLRKALSRFEDLVGASKGQVFLHRSWGLGIVLELDTASGAVVVDFPLKPKQKMTLEGVKTYLERIPNDHIFAAIARDPAGLKARALEDPGAVTRLALKSLGTRLKQSDLKRAMTTRFMSEDEYRRWWGLARTAIKLDPWVDLVGAGAHAELVYRKEPRSFLAESLSKLDKANTVAARREVLRDVRNHGSDAQLTEADMAQLLEAFLRPVHAGKIASPHDLFNYGMLYHEFEDLFGASHENPIPIQTLLKDEKEPGGLILELHVYEHQKYALERLIESRPDWADIFADMLPSADPRIVSWMEKEMTSHGHGDLRAKALEHILARPEGNPDLFIWASRHILEGNWPHVEESIPLILVCEELLGLLAELQDRSLLGGEDAPHSKALTSKIRSLLQEAQFKHMKRAVAKASAKEAAKFLSHIHLHGALPDAFKSQAEYAIHSHHPSLRRVSKAEEEDEKKKPSHHYATGPAVDARREYLSRILNVEIPENSKAIGAARELGDLRENAEYHAAKDRQKLLMQSAAELEDLISRARIIDPEDVVTTSSRFGTRVQVRRTADGGAETYTLLGMWEADQDRNILSYLTPFGGQLMNRSPGEKFSVSFPDGRGEVEYELVSIERAI